MNILRTFEEASGSKINLRKTIGIYIGELKNKPPEYTNLVDNDAICIWKEQSEEKKLRAAPTFGNKGHLY